MARPFRWRRGGSGMRTWDGLSYLMDWMAFGRFSGKQREGESPKARYSAVQDGTGTECSTVRCQMEKGSVGKFKGRGICVVAVPAR